ncbi:uncharacterized mitochondrial protein AtMg00820-like [Lathyrus oleraceus]|uniref:uncharacterized mitochondrial protein AtMg00820-like n=1 Tax=Pisum sativum TaxID=3888 RepID=UPI0021D1A98A|nr:uncharacterized mitochondrial protein AtMg00820-like [Pisum sativum]
MAVTQYSEPKTYEEACKDKNWKLAMNSELKALAVNGTWVLMDMSSNVKPVWRSWVYKIKNKTDGSIEMYKARLVANGYSQVEGLYFFDTFSLVEKLSSVRILLAIESINH